MADTVTNTVVYDSPKHRVITLTNVSDGTGESNVVKVDASALTGPNGSAPTSVSILEVSWDVQGFEGVKLHFDATTDDTALVMSGQGYMDYRDFGGYHNPKSTGYTGDIMISTLGTATSGDTYTITLHLKKKD